MARPPKERLLDSVESLEKSVHEQSESHDFSHVERREYEPTARVNKKSSALRIEPTQYIKVKTTKPLEGEALKERNYMWERVEGVVENRMLIGETIVFWMNPFPGDDYAKWEIPANTLVSIPRWAAKHLNTREYCTFKYREKAKSRVEVDGFMEEFVPDQVHKRFTFMQTGSY